MNSKNAKKYYDEFSEHLLKDYVGDNKRINKQHEFFKKSTSENINSVLIIGSGIGLNASYLAKNILKKAKIIGVDLSEQNVKIANSLFKHENINFKEVDILKEKINDKFELIILPDVYEHIPKEKRDILHKKINNLLLENGKILITCPTPAKQKWLHNNKKEGLQIIDEIVTLKDLIKLAEDVEGFLTYFNIISIWETNDYFHAMIERGANTIQPISKQNKIPIKGWNWKQKNVVIRAVKLIYSKTFKKLLKKLKELKLKYKL